MKCFIQNMNIEYISHLVKQFHFTAVLIFVFLHYKYLLIKIFYPKIPTMTSL